jgi:hypothetical protein
MLLQRRSSASSDARLHPAICNNAAAARQLQFAAQLIWVDAAAGAHKQHSGVMHWCTIIMLQADHSDKKVVRGVWCVHILQ